MSLQREQGEHFRKMHKTPRFKSSLDAFTNTIINNQQLPLKSYNLAWIHNDRIKSKRS